MDETTQAIRDALIRAGASPMLALQLATEQVYEARRHIKREHDTNEAQRLLPLIGAVKAAEVLGVCKKTIYNRNRRKCNSIRTFAHEPA